MGKIILTDELDLRSHAESGLPDGYVIGDISGLLGKDLIPILNHERQEKAKIMLTDELDLN